MIQVKTQKDLTTGQIAKIVGCAPRTVTKWIDGGLLKAYRMPGGVDRRVTREDLAAFMEASGIKRDLGPQPPPESPRREPRILFVGFSAEQRGELMRDGLLASFSQTGPASGFAVATSRPDVVVIDAAMGRIEASQTAAVANAAGAKALIYGPDRGEGFDGWASRPFDLDVEFGRLIAEGGEG